MANRRVFPEGTVFDGYHGVRAAERRLGQRFVVNLTASRDVRATGSPTRSAPATSAESRAR